MKETEVTVEVFDSFEKVNETLLGKGFEVTERYVIYDRYFSGEKNVAALSYAELMKGSVLVRRIDADKRTDQLIYKNKEIDSRGTVLSEEKVKTSLGNADDAAAILALSGLNQYCEITNRSTVYAKGNVCFALQDVDGLGLFIEYEEDGSMKDLPPDVKIELLTDVLKSLGLSLSSNRSCKKVFMKLHKKQ